MDVTFWLILGVTLYAALVALAAAILRAAPEDADYESAIVLFVFRVYARLVHRVRVIDAHNFPRGGAPGPLILAANHSAGVDPILIQAVCPFIVRWVMADDMALPLLEPMWEIGKVIRVDRRHNESMGVRDAIAHLRDGGVIGVFPEGHIERPPRRILPFLPGVGLFVHRTGARVLPIVVEGTPQTDPAWSSLWRTSRATVRVLPVVDYGESGLSAREIAADLRRRFIDATGWEANDSTPRLEGERWVQADAENRRPNGTRGRKRRAG